MDRILGDVDLFQPNVSNLLCLVVLSYGVIYVHVHFPIP